MTVLVCRCITYHYFDFVKPTPSAYEARRCTPERMLSTSEYHRSVFQKVIRTLHSWAHGLLLGGRLVVVAHAQGWLEMVLLRRIETTRQPGAWGKVRKMYAALGGVHTTFFMDF